MLDFLNLNKVVCRFGQQSVNGVQIKEIKTKSSALETKS